MKLTAVSRSMRDLLRQARRYAKVDATVLITGESGSGKSKTVVRLSFLVILSPFFVGQKNAEALTMQFMLRSFIACIDLSVSNTLI